MNARTIGSAAPRLRREAFAAVQPVRPLVRPQVRPAPRAAAGTWRALLLLGVLAAAFAGARLGAPGAALLADPGLARLLRGMAAIKAGLALGGVALLAWRFGRPVTVGVATAYLAGAWTVVAATALIWQLTAIVPAAVGD
jgi:hypothetical protein